MTFELPLTGYVVALGIGLLLGIERARARVLRELLPASAGLRPASNTVLNRYLWRSRED